MRGNSLATRVVTVYTDDRTGEELNSDQVYEHQISINDAPAITVHLGERSEKRLHAELGKYIEASKRKAANEKKLHGSASAKSNASAPAIRKWAQENGVTLQPRGRIPKHIVEKYHASHRS